MRFHMALSTIQGRAMQASESRFLIALPEVLA